MGRLTKRHGNTYVPNENANYEPMNCMDKLGRLEDLEEQGRLIEVVYGFNIQDHDSAFECSVCGFSDWDTLTADDSKYNYCPHCGAKMKLKELEE